jgi:hypothetical protein
MKTQWSYDGREPKKVGEEKTSGKRGKPKKPNSAKKWIFSKTSVATSAKQFSVKKKRSHR